MTRRLAACCCAAFLAAGCAPDPLAAPAPATTAEASPTQSALEGWVSRVCVVELVHELDAPQRQAPVVTARSLPEAKRVLAEWATVVGTAATAMVTDLDQIGPPPEDAGTDAFEEYRERYVELADLAETTRSLFEEAGDMSVLETGTTIIGLQLLATSRLSTDPPLSSLTEKNAMCR